MFHCPLVFINQKDENKMIYIGNFPRKVVIEIERIKINIHGLTHIHIRFDTEKNAYQ